MAYNKKTWQTGNYIYVNDLNHIEDGIEESQQMVNDVEQRLEETKTDRHEMEALVAQLDRAETKVGELADGVDELERRADQAESDIDLLEKTKADVIQADSMAAEIDQVQQEVRDLRQNKADSIALSGVATALEHANVYADELNTVKGDVYADNILAAEVDRTGQLAEHDHAVQADLIHEMTGVSAQADMAGKFAERMRDRTLPNGENETAGMIAELVLMENSLNQRISTVSSNVNTALLNIADVEGDVTSLRNGKVNKPATDGTAGQVLQTNGDGTTGWMTPALPTDEQIGEAVAGWLDDHPEATTTIEDGAVTMEKLSQEVQDAIESDAGVSEYVDGNGLYAELVETDHSAIYKDGHYVDAMADAYEELLYKYGGYFRGDMEVEQNRPPDGFGFIFFTDPHNAAGMDMQGNNLRDLEPQLRLIGKVFERSPAKIVLCGGDWMENDLPIQKYYSRVGRVINTMHREIGPECYTAAGNHEYHETSNPDNYLTPAELGQLWYGRDNCYYLIERHDCNIFVFDSWRSGMLIGRDYWYEQTDWFGQLLLQNTQKHLFGLIHILMGSSEEGYQWIGDSITAMANAFNTRTSITVNNIAYDFSQCTGTFHFFLAGHTHQDANLTVNGMPVIRTRNHAWNFDLCFADFGEGKLHMARAGAGEDREITIIPNIT